MAAMLRMRVAAVVLVVSGCGGGGGRGEPDATTVEHDARINDNATLSALTASLGTLEPPFQPEVTSYDLRLALDDEAVSVTATAAVTEGTTITIEGAAAVSGVASEPFALSPGMQTVSVAVTAASGDTITYSVSVHRGEPGLWLGYVAAPLSNPIVPAYQPGAHSYSFEVGRWIDRV